MPQGFRHGAGTDPSVITRDASGSNTTGQHPDGEQLEVTDG
jgi:hypothetical protein